MTIYTDASILAGCGAWAAVIIRDGHEPREHAGRLRGHFGSSTAVEAAAIANALHRAAADRDLERGDSVLILSDNLNAVQRIGNGNRRKCDPVIRRAIDYVVGLADHLGVELRAEWIKGHQRLDSPDPRALFNRRAARRGDKPPSWRMLLEQHAAFQRRRERREGSKRERAIWAAEDASEATR